jgi:hypothetical protein
MLNLKKNEQYDILINAILSLAALFVIEYSTGFLAASSSSRNYSMPSWGMIFISFVIPLLFIATLSFIAPSLSKWNKQPHGQLVTFFTILGSYLIFEMLRIVIIAAQNLYALYIPEVLSWLLIGMITLIFTTATWKIFYQWRHNNLRAKLIIFIAVTVPLYLLLPLLDSYIWRLTYAIHLYN